MDREKEQWIDEVFDSLKGHEKAMPPTHLLTKIEQNLHSPEAMIIPVGKYRIAVAAAAMLLLVNVLSLYQFSRNATTSDLEWREANAESLISDYKLYDL